ncbi:MAG TPA: DinB family protein [Thermomicrobiaceae bacterium]|nr:DinB family protein [Thermomicrobiaceae bacterium]
MSAANPAGVLYASWEDLDRALAGLSDKEAATRYLGGSSFARTLAHLASTLDTWVNVRFAGQAPHPLLSERRFRMGGSGEADDWPAPRQAVSEVRAGVRDYLSGVDEDELDRVVPYDGSITALREPGVSLRYSLARMAAHHYFHLGEIATKRSLLGHRIVDYPGLMGEAR